MSLSTSDPLGDFNYDGVVNFEDFSILLGLVGSSGRGVLGYDGNTGSFIGEPDRGYSGARVVRHLRDARGEMSFMHMRHRFYDAEQGRWTRRDPLGYVDGMGLYEYVSSSPVDYIDPLGTQKYKICLDRVRYQSETVACDTLYKPGVDAAESWYRDCMATAEAHYEQCMTDWGADPRDPHDPHFIEIETMCDAQRGAIETFCKTVFGSYFRGTWLILQGCYNRAYENSITLVGLDEDCPEGTVHVGYRENIKGTPLWPVSPGYFPVIHPGVPRIIDTPLSPPTGTPTRPATGGSVARQ